MEVTIVDCILAAAILALIVLGYLTRILGNKGTGTLFTVGMFAMLLLLVTTLLGLKKVIPGDAVVSLITGLFTGPIGFAAGRYGRRGAGGRS